MTTEPDLICECGNPELVDCEDGRVLCASCAEYYGYRQCCSCTTYVQDYTVIDGMTYCDDCRSE